MSKHLCVLRRLQPAQADIDGADVLIYGAVFLGR